MAAQPAIAARAPASQDQRFGSVSKLRRTARPSHQPDPHMNDLHICRTGQGPLVVLSHALGTDLHMWDEVAAHLAPHCTVLRYDQRGHGKSPAAAAAPWSIDDLADDAAALIAREADAPVRFVGLSMGGMVAQSLAARHPAVVASIVVANSASHYGDAAKALWQARVQQVREHGVRSIADGAVERWFTADFRAGSPTQVAALRERLAATDAVSYAACCEAIAGIELQAGNARIACPTLVIAGTQDAATPPAQSVEIKQAIPGAELVELDAAHLSAVEQPGQFAAALLAFWQKTQAAAD